MSTSQLVTLGPRLGFALICLYLFVWLLLILHCLRKKAFFPVFRSQRATRIFWLLTSLAFNPALSALYFLFAVLAPAKRRATWWRTAAILSLVAVVITASYIPFTGSAASPETTAQVPTTPLPFWSDTGFVQSVNMTDCFVEIAPVRPARFAAKRVTVLIDGTHPLLNEVAAALSRELNGLAAIDRVDVCTSVHGAPQDSDLVVRLALDEDQVSAFPLPLHKSMSAIVYANASDTIEPAVKGFGAHGTRAEGSSFTWGATLRHHGVTWGLEAASVRYHHAAQNIAERLASSLASALSHDLNTRPARPLPPIAHLAALQTTGHADTILW